MESSTLTTFHPFNRLPEELRLQIWQIASSEPRMLNMRLSPHNQMAVTDFFISKNSVPAVLCTCAESRSEASKLYSRAFYHDQSPRYTWVNFNCDTVRIEDVCLSKVKMEDRARIQRLCLEVPDDELFDQYYKLEMAEMIGLLDVDIIPVRGHLGWWAVLPMLRRSFTRWSAGRPGWVLPNLKMVDNATGLEVQHQGEYWGPWDGRGTLS